MTYLCLTTTEERPYNQSHHSLRPTLAFPLTCGSSILQTLPKTRLGLNLDPSRTENPGPLRCFYDFTLPWRSVTTEENSVRSWRALTVSPDITRSKSILFVRTSTVGYPSRSFALFPRFPTFHSAPPLQSSGYRR